jgi:Putative auto-transporter adhesin, head GIN domain
MTNSLRSLVFMFALAICGCGSVNLRTVVGSGQSLSEGRPIQDVRQIEMSGVGTLILKQSSEESLTVRADDNILPLLKSEVHDGKLTLSLTNNTTIQTKTPIEYTVEVRSLENLELLGATVAKVTALNGSTLVVSLSGASQATLQGKVTSLELSASGASGIDAAELICQTGKVEVSGASHATVHAQEKLDASASGASKVTYLGDPRVKKSSSGASSIQKQ